MPLLANDLNRMMQEGVTIAVRNMQRGNTVYQDETTKIVTVWESNGDPFGGDVKEIPPTYLASPIFREHVLRGILKIEDAPEAIEQAVEGMRQKWANQVQKSANAVQEIEASKDQIVATAQTCIAPKGKELCGSYAVVLGKDPSERPPLCAEHVALAGQYAPQETGRVIDGKPEVIWKRVHLMTRA